MFSPDIGPADWQACQDPRTPERRPGGTADGGPGTVGGPGPLLSVTDPQPPASLLPGEHGLYRGPEQDGLVPYVAVVNSSQVAGWWELPMPNLRSDLCSAWNRILAEPPGSDVHRRLEAAGMPDHYWRTWPLHAVLRGQLAYAQVSLTRSDLAALLGPDVKPTVRHLRDLVEASPLMLGLVEEEPGTDPRGMAAVTVRVARRQPIRELWNVTQLVHAYRHALPPELAERQCLGLLSVQHLPPTYFTIHPEDLARVEWVVLGLVTGDSLGHPLVELARTADQSPEPIPNYSRAS